jgi:hypothetical protein
VREAVVEDFDFPAVPAKSTVVSDIGR